MTKYNKAQQECIDQWGEYPESFAGPNSIRQFLEEFNGIDPTPDPPKYKIIKNNDYVLDDDLTQEEAERYLDSLMKNCLKDFYDLEYYNRGDSLTVSNNDGFSYYNLEQE